MTCVTQYSEKHNIEIITRSNKNIADPAYKNFVKITDEVIKSCIIISTVYNTSIA